MPAIGFGTWQILMNAKAKRVVAEAIDSGYRLIDTAMVYGNEKGVGAAINESHVDRSELFVTTKLWNFDQGYESTHKAFKTSLARLGLQYVDLYLIHWPKSSAQTRDSWRAMEELQADGKARHIGVSNFTDEQLEDLLAYAKIPPAVNQIEFHPFIYEDQKDTLEFCLQEDIIVQAYSPLARAHKLKDPHILQLADIYTKTPAQILLRWALQHRTVPLPKTTHRERMKENLDIFEFELSKEHMDSLNALSSGISVL